MTWTAHLKVTGVAGTSPVVINAMAELGGPLVKPYGLVGPEVPTINSNTEGIISRATLTLEIDTDQSAIQAGDLLTIQGHFNGGTFRVDPGQAGLSY